MPNRETHRYIKWCQYVPYKFTKQDQALLKLINQNGSKQWKIISQLMRTREGIPNRSGKQCRQRWLNHLNDQNKKFVWTDDDDRKLFQLYAQKGTKWCQIVKYFPSNSDSFIKNRFYSLTRKSMRKMCKYCSTKTKTLNIYGVKPSTVASIIFQAEVKDSKQSFLFEMCINKSRQQQFYYKTISQLIKFFAFKINRARNDLQLTPEKVLWALKQIVEIDISLQRQRKQLKVKQGLSIHPLNEQMILYMEVPQLKFDIFKDNSSVIGSQTDDDKYSLLEVYSNEEYQNQDYSVIRDLFGDEQKRVSIRYKKR